MGISEFYFHFYYSWFCDKILCLHLVFILIFILTSTSYSSDFHFHGKILILLTQISYCLVCEPYMLARYLTIHESYASNVLTKDAVLQWENYITNAYNNNIILYMHWIYAKLPATHIQISSTTCDVIEILPIGYNLDFRMNFWGL